MLVTSSAPPRIRIRERGRGGAFLSAGIVDTVAAINYCIDMTSNTVPPNPPTRPAPIGVKNGKIIYDPATWVEDALAVLTWPDDKECFRVIAALVHAGLEGEIPKKECLRLAEKFVENGQGFTKYKPADVPGLMKWIASKPCDRPATLGSIWWMAEQEGWKHTADYRADLTHLHNEMATV